MFSHTHLLLLPVVGDAAVMLRDVVEVVTELRVVVFLDFLDFSIFKSFSTV